LDFPVGRLILLPGGWLCVVAAEPAELFFVAADAGGDCLDRGAQCVDVCGEAGEGGRRGGAVAVVFDDGA
jgi:hypothetical protein